MLRFTYTDMTKLARHVTTDEETIKELIFNPKVSFFPQDDLKQLVKQISIAKNSTKSAMERYMRGSFTYPYSYISLSECDYFIGAMEVYNKYILNNYSKFKEYKDFLQEIIETVIVIKSNKLISNSKDNYLNKKLEQYALKEGIIFSTDDPVFMEERI